MAGALWVLTPVMRAQPLRIMFFKTDRAETTCKKERKKEEEVRY
jgi:hypothetical protein